MLFYFHEHIYDNGDAWSNDISIDGIFAYNAPF